MTLRADTAGEGASGAKAAGEEPWAEGGPLSEAGLGQAAGSEAGGATLRSQLPWAEPGSAWIFLGPWGSRGVSGGI